MGEMGQEKVPTFLTGRQKERLRSGFIDGRIVTVIMKTASEGPGACWEHAWAVSGVCILWSFFSFFLIPAKPRNYVEPRRVA